MTLRKKAIIFLLSFFIVWFVINSIAISKGILANYQTIEEERFKWEIERIEVGISDLVSKHESLLIDWAEWDDAYEYVQNPNEDFERAIYESNHFEKQDMNYYVFYNNEGEVLNADGYDLQKRQSKPVPQKLIDLLPQYRNMRGILDVDGVPMVYVTHEVTNNSAIMPSKGLFAFAYELNEEIVDKLASDLKEAAYLESTHTEMDRGFFSEVVRVNDQAYGKLYYQYDNSNQGIVLSIELDQGIRAMGLQTIYSIMSTFILSFIILVIIIMSVVNRVIRKISKMGRDLSLIDHEGQLTKRVYIKGNDELGQLRDSINALLDALQAAHIKLTHQATFDDLTGVYNRRAGLGKLEDEIEKTTGLQEPLTIVFIDVNDLKTVNDQLGHHVGDDYLIHICHSVKKIMSKDDTLARLGGDEFLVIFPYKTKSDVHDLFEPVHKIIQGLHDQYGLPYKMSISAGIFEYQAEMNIDEFIEKADELMYQEKMANRR
jgi:diguanylate cyclase (GGDEF)-like protein